MTNAEFKPDWVSPPGSTIASLLRRSRKSIDDLAELTQQTPDQARQLIAGESAMTIGVARRLSIGLGGTVTFWMARELRYRQDSQRLDECAHWLTELPVSDMVRFGWVVDGTPDTEAERCFHFFGVEDVAEWRSHYASLSGSTMFRASQSFDSRPGSVAAWIRRAQIEARDMRCQAWNVSALRAAIPELRELTREADPEKFMPRVRDACAASGVRVCLVRAPQGCRASAAVWRDDASQPLVVLSGRHLSDDHFWFSFFHELGHLCLHSDSEVFIESEGTECDSREVEANEFAAEILIPSRYVQELKALTREPRAIMRFARSIGTSPGIVVGQMQHRKLLSFRSLNALKRRYSWETS